MRSQRESSNNYNDVAIGSFSVNLCCSCGSVASELTTLSAIARRALLLPLLGSPEGMLFRNCGVGTAVCGQRADSLPSLAARSHALVYLLMVLEQKYGIYTRSCPVALKAYALDNMPLTLYHRSPRAHMLLCTYLWCWYSSMVSILAPARMLLCSCGVGTAVVWHLTRSCSVALRSCSCALICGACWYSNAWVGWHMYSFNPHMVEPLGWWLLVQYGYGMACGTVRRGMVWVWHGM